MRFDSTNRSNYIAHNRRMEIPRNEMTTLPPLPTDPPYDAYDDNKDIIWPSVVGIFVALALGWMICRYKCSSKERSPHIVRCCPESLCTKIKLCCTCMCRLHTEPSQQQAIPPDPLLAMHKSRNSEYSIYDIPAILNYSAANRQSLQQWPPPFLLNNSTGPPSVPPAIVVPAQQPPKRHPLRRESTMGGMNERRESSLWPFRTSNMVFHKQTSEIKQSPHLYIHN